MDIPGKWSFGQFFGIALILFTTSRCLSWFWRWFRRLSPRGVLLGKRQAGEMYSMKVLGVCGRVRASYGRCRICLMKNWNHMYSAIFNCGSYICWRFRCVGRCGSSRIWSAAGVRCRSGRSPVLWAQAVFIEIVIIAHSLTGVASDEKKHRAHALSFRSTAFYMSWTPSMKAALISAFRFVMCLLTTLGI